MKNFWSECEKVNDVLFATQDDKAAEPHLVKILTQIEQSPKQRAVFVKAFLEILENPDKWSGLIVEFCMHKLRYPEVEQRCIEEMKKERLRYERTLSRRILEAYSDEWWERKVFDYYSKPRDTE
jgi:hypothetical protein